MVVAIKSPPVLRGAMGYHNDRNDREIDRETRQIQGDRERERKREREREREREKKREREREREKEKKR